jgi:tyrosine aminotransferase
VVQPYDLRPERGWEIDLEHLEAQIDERTRAILINNPSNPCGNVLPLSNLRGLLEVAERHCLPVISDEIYGALTFTGHPFHPLASLTTSVPILAVGAWLPDMSAPLQCLCAVRALC